MRHGRDSASATSTRGRALSMLLLAVHLVVFVLGGAVLGESQARAAGARAVASVTATSGSSDGPSVTSSSESHLERAMRARRDRSDRGPGGPALEPFLPSASPTIGPASQVLTHGARSTARGHRRLPGVVNGARGPPQAR